MNYSLLIKKSLVFVFVLTILFSWAAHLVKADDYGLTATTNEVTDSAGNKMLAKENLALKIGTVVGYLLSFVGLIFLILIIYGGVLWMTAGGDKAQIDKAVNLFTQAVWGLLIVSAAYLITQFVGDVILGQFTGDPSAPSK